jgi:hypothetical protein
LLFVFIPEVLLATEIAGAVVVHRNGGPRDVPLVFFALAVVVVTGVVGSAVVVGVGGLVVLVFVGVVIVVGGGGLASAVVCFVFAVALLV